MEGNVNKEARQRSSLAQGWVTAYPLEHYSSMHILSLLGLMGWKKWPQKLFKVEFNFNLHTPFHIHPEAYLSFHTQDTNRPVAAPNCCFSISEFKRWRLEIGSFSSFEDYLSHLKRWHHCNYAKSKKIFEQYGTTCAIIEDDWTPYVDEVYKLYYNVALKHGEKLYDLNFFKQAAKRGDYKLVCAWFEREMVAMFVLQEELPTLHSICCGLDYNHSTKSYAYSWLNYALISHAIETKKYQFIDIGLTADDSKRIIGFQPISSRMDIYSKGVLTRSFLQLASKVVCAHINPEGQLKVTFKK